MGKKGNSQEPETFCEMLKAVTQIQISVFDTNFKLLNEDKKIVSHTELLTLLLQGTPRFWEGQESVGQHEIFLKPDYLKGPLIFTNELGMTWMADFQKKEGKPFRIYNMGPVFLDDYSYEKLEKQIEKRKPSVSVKRRAMKSLQEIPVIDLHRFYEYGMMLHYMLSGQKISIQDFVYPEMGEETTGGEILQQRHGLYHVENEIMKLVEEGNPGYKKEMEKLISKGHIGRMSKGNAVREAKNLVIVFAALCCRAAINGGLSTEVAYHLREFYIRAVEDAEYLGRVNEVSHAMLEEFVRRVRKAKLADGEMSPQIYDTCNYIDLHLGENTEISLLAARLNYSDYYFSSKFKSETGENVRDYINRKRLEKAAELLKNTNKEIQEICEVIGFSSPSYFGKLFKMQYGVSPGNYRKYKSK